MFDSIRAGGTFHEQCHKAGVEPLCGARTVQHLCLVDAVTVTRAAEPDPLEERDIAVADDEAVRECVRMHVKLLAEFAAPIVAVEGGAGIRERLERVIEEAAQRYPELLSELNVGEGGGLDPEELITHKRKTGSLQDFPGTEPMSNEDLLELDVDVLYPSALENVITADNADRIRARMICELANGPTTPEADRILCDKGVTLLPDFMANAGGVTVSYFEQVQNTYNYSWSIERVHTRLERRMTDAFNAVWEMARSEKVHMRLAAYLVAVERVAQAVRDRGWL